MVYLEAKMRTQDLGQHVADGCGMEGGCHLLAGVHFVHFVDYRHLGLAFHFFQYVAEALVTERLGNGLSTHAERTEHQCDQQADAEQFALLTVHSSWLFLVRQFNI